MSLASDFKALAEQAQRDARAKSLRMQAAKADATALRVRLLLGAGATHREASEILGVSIRTVDRAVKRKKEN